MDFPIELSFIDLITSKKVLRVLNVISNIEYVSKNHDQEFFNDFFENILSYFFLESYLLKIFYHIFFRKLRYILRIILRYMKLRKMCAECPLCAFKQN